MRVLGAIEPSLRKAELERVRRQRPSNLNAYDLVLRSLPLVLSEMSKDAELAVPLLQDALKIEPDYSAANAFLSWCFHVRFARGGAREEDRIAAVRHAHAAITDGNDDATVVGIAAFVMAMDEHDTTTALKLFDQALRISNSNVFALTSSAVVLAWMGKAELAIDRAKQALQLSPFDPFNWRSNSALAIAYFHTQEYDNAEDAARDAIRSNSNFSIVRAVLAAALLRLGRVDEARAAARAVLECQSSFTISGTSRYVALEPLVFGDFADAWRELGLPE